MTGQDTRKGKAKTTAAKEGRSEEEGNEKKGKDKRKHRNHPE